MPKRVPIYPRTPVTLPQVDRKFHRRWDRMRFKFSKKAQKGTIVFYPNGDSSAKHRVLSCLIGDLIRKLQIDTRLFVKIDYVDLTGKKSRKLRTATMQTVIFLGSRSGTSSYPRVCRCFPERAMPARRDISGFKPPRGRASLRPRLSRDGERFSTLRDKSRVIIYAMDLVLCAPIPWFVLL